MPRRRDSRWDEINDVGTVEFTACAPREPDGINIVVADCWDDSTPLRRIMLTCNGAVSAIEYTMDVDKAEALGLLLCSAAREMRTLATQVDADMEE